MNLRIPNLYALDLEDVTICGQAKDVEDIEEQSIVAKTTVSKKPVYLRLLISPMKNNKKHCHVHLDLAQPSAFKRTPKKAVSKKEIETILNLYNGLDLDCFISGTFLKDSADLNSESTLGKFIDRVRDVDKDSQPITMTQATLEANSGPFKKFRWSYPLDQTTVQLSFTLENQLKISSDYAIEACDLLSSVLEMMNGTS